MKTLIIYFAANSIIEKLSYLLMEELNADISEINEINHYNLENKFIKMVSFFRSKVGILPLDNNVSEYDNIVILVPTYRSKIPWEICSFIRNYYISEKKVYAVICYEQNIDESEKNLNREFENNNIRCSGAIEINMLDEVVLSKIRNRELIFSIDRYGIYLRDSKIKNLDSNNPKIYKRISNIDDIDIDFSYNYRMNKSSGKK